MRLAEIATGWMNFINASPEHQQMSEYRLNICDSCPQKKQLSPIGKKIVEDINDKASIYYCGQCKCPLASATVTPGKACPLGKWQQWITKN